MRFLGPNELRFGLLVHAKFFDSEDSKEPAFVIKGEFEKDDDLFLSIGSPDFVIDGKNYFLMDESKGIAFVDEDMYISCWELNYCGCAG